MDTHDDLRDLLQRPIVRPSAETEAYRRDLTIGLFERIESADDEVQRASLRSSVVCVNMPMARAVARRFDHRGESREDLCQVAYLGLSKATERFRLAERKDFLTFAVPTITGELRNHFRDLCWAVRPPRRVQQLQAQVKAVCEDHAHRTGRTPTPRQIATALEVDEAAVVEALVAHACFGATSLDAPVGDRADGTWGDRIPDEVDAYDQAESAHVLVPAMRCLDATERELVGLWIFHDWSQQRIADRVGMTQVQVSRAIARALARVRESIGSIA